MSDVDMSDDDFEYADDPGVKGEDRSREKMRNDYDGHANCLTAHADSTSLSSGA